MEVFRSPIQTQPNKATQGILAAIALHNWLKKHNDCQKSYGCLYCPPGYVDYEDCHGIVHKGTWRSDISEADALSEISQIGPNTFSKAVDKFCALMADVLSHLRVNCLGSMTLLDEPLMSLFGDLLANFHSTSET